MFPLSRSAEQLVQTVASRRRTQTNVMDPGEVPVTVAASHSDSATDALDAIEQRWLEMQIEVRQEIGNELSEMGNKMRLEIAKELSEFENMTRQEILEKFTPMLPKASNGNGDVTTSSRSQETYTSALLRSKGESLPEITTDLADTGIIGIVDVLGSFNSCFPISYGVVVKYMKEYNETIFLFCGTIILSSMFPYTINETPDAIKNKIYTHSLHGFICYNKNMFAKYLQ